MRFEWMVGVGLGLVVACGGDDASPAGTNGSSTGSSTTDASGTTATATSDGSASTSGASGGPTTTTGASVGEGEAQEFLARIPGLWVGPVDSSTSVGDFPTMNMDVRPVDGHVLFSRVDLDPDNNLRFLFTFEDHGGSRRLVFRNGGEFLGILRDTRTVLDSADPAGGQWTFCALDGGCDYVEAVFSFGADESLTLDVTVRSMMHFTWPTTRRETRSTPDPFPIDSQAGAPDDPFPPMPTLRATLRWAEPLPEDTSAWLLVGSQPCGVNPASCTPSRFMRATAPAGATEVEVVVEQIHPGDYFANAILDRNGNLGSGSLLPDAGDLLALPDQGLQVAPSGESTASIMLLVEL